MVRVVPEAAEPELVSAPALPMVKIWVPEVAL